VGTTCLWRDEQLFPLPPKPLAVLAHLVARAGHVVTKDEILEAVWPETMVSEGVLKTCLAQIRRVFGKTSLVDAFMAQIATNETIWLGRGQCIEQYGAEEAYLPLLEAFEQLGRGRGGARLVELLRQQAPSWLLQMPALLPATAHEVLQQRSSGTTRERMLRELAEAVETLTLERPLVLVVEDLH
jgi:DNA-binding SARP family transcriptional activator